MKKLTAISAVLLLAIPLSCMSEEKEANTDYKPGISTSYKEDFERVLSEVAPEQFAKFKALDAKTNALEAAEAIIELTKKTGQRSVGYKGPNDPSIWKRHIYIVSHKYAWARAVEIYKQTSDLKARSRILEEWDAALQNDPEDVEWQIGALHEAYDEDFITPKSAELLECALDHRLVCAFANVFRWRGTEKAEKLLDSKLEQLKNIVIAPKERDFMIGSIESALERVKDNILFKQRRQEDSERESGGAENPE